ncbi:aminotransferase class V-fold PLP-dependent enzyme [Lutibaculum baratangense]|uniref:Cysteine desulfurase n=1 Tax=Lutibaculum baratangense AMV1 TaxID=631454 RepID=V4TBP2_9HYPH|nr:aminotransferase class V-fold PLP-dependent enzyme [Lutibaculum baratangense]ESR23808.1 Cysteine desulfurase [Lutibaculum baratangense AMV1]
MSDPIAALRTEFPGTEETIYLDVAARGLISRGVRGVIDEYLDHRMFEGGDKAQMFAGAEAARDSLAGLIGASPEEVAFTKNVSDGINAFAHAIDWVEGDNVVICEALEHPANIFPWRNLARRRGIRVKQVHAHEGRVPLERVIEAIDARTRVVTVSSVSFSPGFRFPVAELGAICRERGVLLLVDAAQSLGILDTDVSKLHADAVAVSTQKGLLGLYGAGFLYVRNEVAQTLQPLYLSRAGVGGGVHEASSGDLDAFDFADGARRFDVGNHNFCAVLAVGRSIEDLRALGMPRVEAHACGLARRLAEGLEEVGLPVFGGAAADDRAHIVSMGRKLSDEHDRTEDSELVALHDFLTRNRVRLTIRRGMMRFSLHVYNNDDDVDEVISLARAWRSETAPRGGTRGLRHEIQQREAG